MERIFFGHVAHALLMQEELTRLTVQMPERYRELAPEIGPLLTIQTVEMARKLVGIRIELDSLGANLGIDHIATPTPPTVDRINAKITSSALKTSKTTISAPWHTYTPPEDA
jgi:hypothetical protein